MSSGFRLLDLKKESHFKKKELYKRHLVVGEDLYSALLYFQLVEKFGEEEVAFICPHEFTQNDRRFVGPSTLRGKKNIEVIEKLYPNISLKKKESPSLFYKEGKWRSFGGRVKPQKLSENEKFFTEGFAEISFEDLFPLLKKEKGEDDILESLERVRMDTRVKDIRRIISSDLIDAAHFQIAVTSGELISCENLYWGNGPYLYLEHYGNKSELSHEFIEFCESVRNPTALLIRFEYETSISKREESFFLPCSSTYEKGYFIGEFKELRDAEEGGRKGQALEVVTFMDPSESGGEAISKKVRLLKKNIEKIFSLKKANFSSEFIKLHGQYGCLKIDDGACWNLSHEFSHLFFCGENAPLRRDSSFLSTFEDSGGGPSFLSRGVLANRLIMGN